MQFNRTIQSGREDNRHYYAMHFYSGIRTGGVNGLRWERVDSKRGLITIKETLV
jgi:integrase